MTGLWSKLRRVRLKHSDFKNVPPSTAFTMILFGLVHLLVNIGGVIDLVQIGNYNWGIYKSLGLADTLQVPLMIGLLIFDGFIMSYGIYLLKHIEEEDISKKKDLKKKYPDYFDKEGKDNSR